MMNAGFQTPALPCKGNIYWICEEKHDHKKPVMSEVRKLVKLSGNSDYRNREQGISN